MWGKDCNFVKHVGLYLLFENFIKRALITLLFYAFLLSLTTVKKIIIFFVLPNTFNVLDFLISFFFFLIF